MNIFSLDCLLYIIDLQPRGESILWRIGKSNMAFRDCPAATSADAPALLSSSPASLPHPQNMKNLPVHRGFDTAHLQRVSRRKKLTEP